MHQRDHSRRQPQSAGEEGRLALDPLESRVDEALIESFPASDAPYWTLGTDPLGAVREFRSSRGDIEGGAG